MADIKYLNYGNQQVDEQALLTSMANDVQNYVNSQPWSSKRKQKFMTAYSDIMNRGIQGASNETGQWRINVGGDPYPFDQMDKKDREMYGEAAYFIQQQMNRLATTPKTEEEKAEEIKLTPYGSKFGDVFGDYIGRTYFGNRNFNIGGEKDDWNYLDERDAQGIRGRQNRSERLAQYLESYRDSLKENTYDFTDSPFSSLDDLKNKLNSAINALRTGENTQDDTDTLNALGLDARDWFNNGSGDIYVDENGQSHTNPNTQKPFTFAEWNNYQNQLNTQKQEQETAAAEAKQKALDALEIYTSKPHQKIYTFDDLANKYGNTDSFIQSFKNKQVQNLSQEESDELTSFFYTLNGTDDGKQYLQDLTDEEWEPLKSKLQPLQSQYGYGTIERSKNQFKKIQGLDGVYYDTVQNTLVQVGQKGQQPLEDLFSGLSDKEKEEAYLNSKIPGVTNAEWKELSAIAADIVSIIDPEPFTAGGLGIAAADLRRRALNETPGHKWGFWDIVGQGIDYATGALAAIPGFGDATLAAKLATKISPTLRIVGRLGAWKDLYDSIPGLKAVYDKAMNGEELTVGDWRLIGQGIRGLVAHGRMNKSNLAERKIIQESGYTPEQVSGMRGKVKEYGQKTGFLRTEVPKETITPTIKAEVNGKTKEISITENQKAKIEAEVKKAGNDVEKRNRAVEEVLKAEKLVDSSDRVSVEAPSWRDSRFSLISGTSSRLFGSQSTSTTRGTDNFENWLTTRGTASRLLYGTDNSLRRMRRWMGITNGTTQNPTTQSSTENPSNISTTTPKSTNQTQQNTSNREPQYRRAVINRYKNILSENFSKNPIQEGKFKFNDVDVQITKNPTGTHDIYINGKKVDAIKDLSEKEVKQQIAKLVQEHRASLNKGKSKDQKVSTAEIGKILQELKKKGWLKQGGKITNEQIDKFLQQ